MLSKLNTINLKSIHSLSYIFLFFLLSIGLSSLFLINIKVGILFLLGAILLLTLIFKPFFFYLIFVSLLSFEAFTVIEKVSLVKIIGIILASFIALKLIITKEKTNIITDSFYIYFSLFLIGALVSTFVAKEYMSSLSMLLTYFSFGILYFITRYFLQSIDAIDITFNVIIVSTILIFLIVQSLGLSVQSQTTSRITGGIEDPNAFASFILILLPFALYRTMRCSNISKLLFFSFFVGLMIILIYTGSRGGIVGFCGLAVVLIYHYGTRRIIQIFFLIILIAVTLYFLASDEFWFRASTIIHPETEKGSSILTRILLYKSALQMFLDHPLIGVGIYNFQFNVLDYGLVWKSTVTHNTYLELLSGGGLLCFIPFSLIIIDSWRKLKLNKKYDIKIRDLIICLRASFVSILLSAFFISADHMKILWLLLALISSVHYIAINNRTKLIPKKDNSV